MMVPVHGPLARWDVNDRIPNLGDMPVLSRWLDRMAPSQPLRGVTALMLQHQLGNHVPQTQALIRLGLDPANIFWIDIPYTSTSQVREALRDMGVPKRNLLTGRFRLLDNYASYQRLRVQKFVRKLSKSPPDHLLVLDDGAYLLEALSCQRHALTRISIVEQTTRGLIKIQDNAAVDALSKQWPVVDVAGSTPKRVLEPPFIGAAVCHALRHRLGSKVHASPHDRCLLLGYGAIGRQVAAFVHSEFGFVKDRIHVHDPVETAMQNAVKNGFTPFDRHSPSNRFRLVIGCSGRASFKLGDHVMLEDGAFLASATSGTVELSREQFIELAESSPYDDIWIVKGDLDEQNVHSDIEFHFIDRNVTFLNGGFPINFAGNVNCVPAHYIQPTPTMMCAAALQAVKTEGGGLIPLNSAFCNELVADFQAELKDEAWVIGAPTHT